MAEKKIPLREYLVFSMLACVMFCSRLLMQSLPNIHLLGMLIVAITAVYRTRALIPLYLYVALEGVYSGFAPWWVPYLYVWTVLWGVTMLLPKRLDGKWASVAYTAASALHGLFFGVLYAPGQALMYGFGLEQTLAWIASGFTFDVLHFAGNLLAGFLILPLVKLMRQLNDK